MPNRKKTERNQKIFLLFDGGKGLTQKAIAEALGMTETAVYAVIRRDRISRLETAEVK